MGTGLPDARALRHEGLCYRGTDDLVGQLAPFLADGVAGGEPVLVLERPEVIDGLRDTLGAASSGISFVDMTEVGRNPACIIPVWHDFAEQNAGRTARGVGEPLWPGRSPAEAAECHIHESLINRMFADVPLWVLCPYDDGALATTDLEAMTHTHPVVRGNGHRRPVDGFDPDHAIWDLLAEPLTEPDQVGPELAFGAGDVAALRAMVEVHAMAAALPAARQADVALAISELATNSIRHGGGAGTLRSWTADHRVVHEISDAGRLTDPTVGRWLPPQERPGGRGLWLVNQLCDLVQVRTSSAGTTVRIEVGP